MSKETPRRTRSRMAGIPTKGTWPEMAMRRRLWAMGVRYRKNLKSLPGSPDIVIRHGRIAVFVNGCFWHQHPGCPRARKPTSNVEFWALKFKRNAERDDRAIKLLEMDDWTVIVVWECDIRRDPDQVAHQIMETINERRSRDREAGTAPRAP